MSKNRYLIPAVVLLVSLPLLLLAGLEISFRLAGWGQDWSLVEKAGTGGELLRDNRYYHEKFYPSPASAPLEETSPNLFSAEKPAGILRGIVLGESTPQGFPFATNQGFVKMAESGINMAGGKKHLEILNFSKTAMTSYYVRDAAPEALELDPDFLVVYVGHNEYYGNMGEASGGNHFTRLLTLALKNSYVFQAVSGLLAGSAGISGDTLMAEKFAGSLFPPDPERDAQVARNLLDNLSAVAELSRSRNIPVFIFVPAANLGSMPPFSGRAGSSYQELWKRLSELQSGRSSSLETFRADVSEALRKDPAEPHLQWVSSLLITLDSGTVDQEGFRRAADNDSTPFRIRGALSQALREAAPGWGPGVTLIDLPRELEKRFGSQWSSDMLFLDHVHFNKVGQAAAASVLAGALVKALDLKVSGASLAAHFNVPEKVWLSVGLNPLSEARAYIALRRLFQAPPFSTMEIPYLNGAETYFQSDSLWALPDVASALASGDLEALAFAVLRTYERAGDFGSILNYLQTEVFLNPGLPEPYGNLFKAALGTPAGDAELRDIAWKASGLSASPEEFLNSLKEAAFKAGRTGIFSEE